MTFPANEGVATGYHEGTIPYGPPGEEADLLEGDNGTTLDFAFEKLYTTIQVETVPYINFSLPAILIKTKPTNDVLVSNNYRNPPSKVPMCKRSYMPCI